MANENLNAAVASVSLGGGGVYNLMNYIGAFHLSGGLKRYTLGKDYFRLNIENNRAGGKKGRYGYGDAGTDAETVKKEIINGTDGVVYDSSVKELVSSTHSGDRIGDYYTTKTVPRISEKQFMDVRTFSKLGEEIRKRQSKGDFEQYLKETKYVVNGWEAFALENNSKNNTLIKNRNHFGDTALLLDNIREEHHDVLDFNFSTILDGFRRNSSTPQSPYGNEIEKEDENTINVESNDSWEERARGNKKVKTPQGFEKEESDFPEKFSVETVGTTIRTAYLKNSFYNVIPKNEIYKKTILERFGKYIKNRISNKKTEESDNIKNTPFIFKDTKKVKDSIKNDLFERVSFDGDTVENGITSKKGTMVLTLERVGLYDFYNGTDDDAKKAREGFVSVNKEKIKNAVQLRRENRSRNQAARLYYNAYYGDYDVLKTEPEATNYVVPDAYKYNTNEAKEGKFSTKDFKKSLISAGIKAKPESRQYSYYQESGEKKGKTFGAIDSFGDIVIGTLDVEEDKENENNVKTFNPKAYTLVNKVNRMFQEGTIKSLINRFHTEAVDGDDLTTAGSSYGLSRGRNLLRKDAEGGKNSNKSVAGFDNPYCRVWTAHHQYAKISDLIRPIGDDKTTISDLQKKLYGGKDERNLMRPNPELFTNSVLQDSGFVRITPQKDKDGNFEGKENLKPYMFSIENLAWKGFAKSPWLSKEQIGPNGGRIMWFPPYNLKFTENVNTSWKDNDFIGRGEKIYTYVNTERAGTLNFTLLIDHPSFLNKLKTDKTGENGVSDNDILRYFAGCQDEFTFKKNEKENKHVVKRSTKEKKNVTYTEEYNKLYTETRNYIIFFPNDFSGIDEEKNIEAFKKLLDTYETTDDGSECKIADSEYGQLSTAYTGNLNIYALNTSSGLSAKMQDVVSLVTEIKEDSVRNKTYSYTDLKEIEQQLKNGGDFFGLDPNLYEVEKITFGGHASSHGKQAANEKLCSKRARVMRALIKHIYADVDTSLFSDTSEDIKTTINVKNTLDAVAEDKGTIKINNLDAKIARCATVQIVLQLKEKVKIPHETTELIPIVEEYDVIDGKIQNRRRNNGKSEGMQDNETYGGVGIEASHIEGDWTGTREYIVYNNAGEYTYQNEYLYFETIKKENNIVYKNIVDKIKYFDPAFHSVTPEGFNARLNFLHQSTRQGPTIGSHGGGAVVDNGSGGKIYGAAGNMAFGMAPYCVLRIGDFFNSKICITSLQIDYDNGGGVQWDLNPEGAGVQPMMANISISFNFVGGQDITGPIAELQNALSFRYYANTSLYEEKEKINAKVVGFDNNGRPIYSAPGDNTTK